MLYVIDGYNLMYRVLRVGEDLQKQRESVIHDLSVKIQILGLKVILVFDAQHQLGEEQRTRYTPFEIVFSPHGKTADECILDLLKRQKTLTQVTVVTSDKKLAWLARRQEAKTENVEDFMAWLTKRVRNKVRRRQWIDPAEKSLPSIKKKKNLARKRYRKTVLTITSRFLKKIARSNLLLKKAS